jgi:DNA-binding MarR family transcriptional regulator
LGDELKLMMDSYYEYWFGISAFYESWAKKRGLTSNGLFVLYVIREHPGSCTQRLICEKLLLPKQTVNTILESFEKKGYVLKKTREEDRRNKYLLFTELGQSYTDGLLGELFEFEERALFNMQPSTRTQLLESSHLFLNQLLTSFEAEEEKPSTGDS